MLADDAARVLAGGAGFGAEARRVGRERDGQARFVENLVAIEIGDGNLGGGDEPVVVVFVFAARGGFRVGIGAAEQVLGKLGQLAGAEERLGIDHERRQHFGVAVLLRVHVEHEADERALEARARAHVDGKTRAARAWPRVRDRECRGLRRSPSEAWAAKSNFFCSPQVLTVLLSASEAPAGTSSRVRLGTRARDWRNCSSSSGGSLVELVEFVFQGAGLFHHGRGFVVFAGLFERAHLLREFVAAGFELFGEGDGFAAAFIEGAKIAQQSGRIGAARAQLFFHQFQVGANEWQIEHISLILDEGRGTAGQRS